jgi:hypothetical protein
MRVKRRTIMISGEPERVPRPYGDEPLTTVSKSMGHHILNAMRLRRAPYHNVKPSARLRRKEIRAKGGEVRTTHDAARGRMGRLLMVVVMASAEGPGGTRGAEEERAVEV